MEVRSGPQVGTPVDETPGDLRSEQGRHGTEVLEPVKWRDSSEPHPTPVPSPTAGPFRRGQGLGACCRECTTTNVLWSINVN